jgi:hypothetical protein
VDMALIIASSRSSPGPQPTGPEGFSPPEAVVCRTVDPTGVTVLNANDPATVDLVQHTRGQVDYYSMNREHPAVVKHLQNGAWSIVPESTPTSEVVSAKIV